MEGKDDSAWGIWCQGLVRVTCRDLDQASNSVSLSGILDLVLGVSNAPLGCLFVKMRDILFDSGNQFYS